MSAPPYQKFFWGSYHKHTAHLQHAREHGAYLLLIGALWNNGGRLPANDDVLAGYAKLSTKEWLAIKPRLMPMFRVVRGKLTQPRVTEDLDHYKITSCKRKAAGKRGGETTARNRTGNGAANAAVLPTKPEPESEPEYIGDGGERAGAVSDDWPEGNAANHAALIVAEVGSPWLDPNKSLALNTTTGRIAAWRRDGASWSQDVLPVIGALCAKQRGPVSSWKFFDGAIGRSIAENRAALEIPAATARATGPPSLTDRIAADHAEARRKAFALMDAQDGHSH